MGKWYYHNKKMIHRIIFTAVILLLAAYVGYVIYFNVTARDRVFKEFEMGETVEYKGANVVFKDYEVYASGEELMEAYDLEIYEVASQMLDKGCTSFVVGYEIEKLSEDAMGPDWTESYLYPFETCNPPYIFMADALNENLKPFSAMEVGEKQYVKLACYIYNFNLIKKHRNNLEDMKMHLYLPDYEGHEYITVINLN